MIADELSQLQQNPWLLVPFALTMLLMVHAMMEFTVSLLLQKPPPNRKPVRADLFRQRLLSLNTSNHNDYLVTGGDCDLEIYWKQESESRPSGFSITRSASDSRIRFLLDELRHEVRVNQISRSYFIFLGLNGWLPRIRGFASIHSGPPGQIMVEEISRAAARSGWGIRPVLWPFQATFGGYQLLETITPAPLRRWSARRFWGFLYPLSFFLGLGWFVAIAGPLDGQDILLIFIVVAAWWGIWAIFIWLMHRLKT